MIVSLAASAEIDNAAFVSNDDAERETALDAAVAEGASVVPRFAEWLHGHDARHVRAAHDALDRIVAQARGAERDAVASALLDALHVFHAPNGVSDLPLPEGGLQRVLRAYSRYFQQRAQGDVAAGEYRAVREYLLALAGLAASEGHVARLMEFAGDADLAPALPDIAGGIRGEAADAARAALLDHDDAKVRVRAAAGLGARNDTKAIGILRARLAREPEPEVKWACREALAALGVPPWDNGEAWPGAKDAKARWIALGLRAAQVHAEAGRAKEASGVLNTVFARGARWHETRAALNLFAAVDAEEGAKHAMAYVAVPELRGNVVALLAASKAKDADERLVRAFKGGNAAAKGTLLEALQRRASPSAAKLAREAMASGDPALRAEAARVSGGETAEEDLLALARDGAAAQRGPALRAFLDRAHAMAAGNDRAAAADRFRAVYAGPFGSDAHEEALEGLGACAQPADRKTIEEALDDPALEHSAQRALALYWSAHAGEKDALATLTRMAERNNHDDVAQLAASAVAAGGGDLTPVARTRGWLCEWRVLGPFPLGDAAIDAAPVPEGGLDAKELVDYNGEALAWRSQAATGLPAQVDFNAAFGPQNAALAYAATRVVAAAWTPVYLTLETDEAATLTLNGQSALRAESPEAGGNTTRAFVTLRPGVNRIVIKSQQTRGDWRVALRLTLRDGKPFDLRNQKLPDDGMAMTGLRGAATKAAGNAQP